MVKVRRLYSIGFTMGSAVAVVIHTPDVAACGGGGLASADGVVVDAQRVIISARSGGTTDIVAQINVPQTSSDYGMLIPVPSEPTLDPNPVSATDLAALDDGTAPEILTDDGSSDDDGPLIGCGSGTKGGDSSGPPSRGVTAGPPVEIGPIVAVSLTGESAEAVNSWLADNNFVLPSADVSTLERYISPGSYLIAIRRSERAATFAPSSIGIHYSLKGDHRTLSLGFASIGAAAEMAFTVFLAATETTGPSEPFAALTLKDLDGALLKNGDYKGAVKKAVAGHNSKAFVLERTIRAEYATAQAPSLKQLFDPDAIITRATTVVASEELSTDVVFATPFKDEVPNSRFASADARRSGTAGFNAFGLLVVGAAVGMSLRRVGCVNRARE